MVFVTSKHLFYEFKSFVIFLKISLAFFYLNELRVLGFFQFEGDLVCGQNNSREFVAFLVLRLKQFSCFTEARDLSWYNYRVFDFFQSSNHTSTLVIPCWSRPSDWRQEITLCSPSLLLCWQLRVNSLITPSTVQRLTLRNCAEKTELRYNK